MESSNTTIGMLHIFRPSITSAKLEHWMFTQFVDMQQGSEKAAEPPATRIFTGLFLGLRAKFPLALQWLDGRLVDVLDMDEALNMVGG